MSSRWTPRDVEIAPVARVGRGLLAALAVLCALELALQVRSQLLSGQSAFTRLAGRPTYVTDPATGLRLLRPDAEIRGQRTLMHTNRYGLRGAGFAQQRPREERRIVLLGASTIMGTYASNDAATSSARLEALLESAGFNARVINAGVAGLTVGGQATLLEKKVLGFEPDTLIWYPGLNDFGCRPKSGPGSPPVRWRMPPTPSWLILPDIVTKNTVWLRVRGRPTSTLLEPDVDLPLLERELRAGVERAKAAGVQVALATSARNFSADMPEHELVRRAATALNVRPCYSAVDLARAALEYDDLIRAVARDERVVLVDASRLIPPDAALFGDSTHLSAAGEQTLARLIYDTLFADELPEDRP
jgi:lysophospholipase L1-like esterase